jgi:hypothetical protein
MKKDNDLSLRDLLLGCLPSARQAMKSWLGPLNHTRMQSIQSYL